MKKRISWNWSLRLALIVLPLVVGCAQQAASSPETAASVNRADLGTDPALVMHAVPEVADAAQAAKPEAADAAAPETADAAAAPEAEDVSDAPVKPVSTEKPLPAKVNITGPAQEIVRLTSAGVEENVMLAYVTNSPSTFNLNSDQIIYLNDIGVPPTVVTAMIQRDQVLKVTLQASAPAPAPAPAPPAETAPPAQVPTVTAPLTPSEPVAVSAGGFYDSLAPYGTWVDVEGYGRCWQPTVVVVNPGWQPYFDSGHWVYTDCGWYWYSDYSWGWAPFHYGRWFRHVRLGWCWAPDTVWGPSWVSWRYNGDYCGWAPLPPRAYFRPGYGFAYYGPGAGWSFDFGISMSWYCFVPLGHFHEHHLHHWAVPHRDVARIYNRTTVVNRIVVSNNRVVNHGIAPERVAAATRTPVRRVTIRETTTVASRGGRSERLDTSSRTLSVFRPRLAASTPSPAVNTDRVRHETAAASPSGGRPGRQEQRVATSRPERVTAAPVPTQPEPSSVRSAPSQGRPTRGSTISQSGTTRSTPTAERQPTVNERGRATQAAPNPRTGREANLAQPATPAPAQRQPAPTPSDRDRNARQSRPAQSSSPWSQPAPTAPRAVQPNVPPPAAQQPRVVYESPARTVREYPAPRYEAPKYAPSYDPGRSAPARQEAAPSYQAPPRNESSRSSAPAPSQSQSRA